MDLGMELNFETFPCREMSSRCLTRSTDFWKMQTNQRKADTSWSSAVSLHPMENTNNIGDDVLSTFQNWPLQIHWWFPSPTTFPCCNDPIFANWMKPLQIYFGLFSTFTKISSLPLSSNHGTFPEGDTTVNVFSRWFQGVHGFIFIRAIFLHNVG